MCLVFFVDFDEKFKKIDEKRLKKLKERDLPTAIEKQIEINKKIVC